MLKLCDVQTKLLSRNASLRAKAGQKEAVKKSPPAKAEKQAVKQAPPAKEEKQTGLEISWQPGLPHFSQQSSRHCHICTSCFDAQFTNAGTPEPLGPSLGPSKKGVNFALYSEHATAVALEIFTEEDNSVHEIMLDPKKHKTEHVWHVLVDTLPASGVLYAYKVQGEGGWETGGRSAASLPVANFVLPL